MTRLKKCRALLAVLVAMVAAGVGSASAQATPYVWNDYTGWVAMYGLPNTGANVYQYSRNGTRFAMRCWLDNQNRRWFYGQIYDTGRWLYVEARWVGSQWSVGHC